MITRLLDCPSVANALQRAPNAKYYVHLETEYLAFDNDQDWSRYVLSDRLEFDRIDIRRGDANV